MSHYGGATTKSFVVKSLAKCNMPGDLDHTLVYTCDPEFSEGLAYLDGRRLGGSSLQPDSCNVQIQFQQRGTVESLGEDGGVIKSNTGSTEIRYSFKASDLYFDAGITKDPYNCSWTDLAVGKVVYFIPFRNRGVLKQRSQAAPVLQRALSITLHERIITHRVSQSPNVPQGTIAIPKWMWPQLCPLTAAESGSITATAPASSSLASTALSSSAAASEDAPDAAAADTAAAQFPLDGLRERTVRVTLVFSSQLPVATSARWTCLSKRSLIPGVPVPNFTELTSWLHTFLGLTSSGVRRAVVTMCCIT